MPYPEALPEKQERTVELARGKRGVFTSWVELTGGNPVRGLLDFEVADGTKLQIVRNALTRELCEAWLIKGANDLIEAFALK